MSALTIGKVNEVQEQIKRLEYFPKRGPTDAQRAHLAIDGNGGRGGRNPQRAAFVHTRASATK